MSMTGLGVFDSTLQKTNIWLKDIMDKLQWSDRHRAYLVLRAILHALRDRLPAEEAAHLGAELPMLIRGIFYEGWSPSGKPIKAIHQEEFLLYIESFFPNDPDVDAAEVAGAVFEVLSERISGGEIQDIKGALPSDLQELWPEMVATEL